MSKRILVVEDQEDSRRILRDLLSSADYEMTEAVNGEQALAAVAKQRPDLILMDIQMPVMDGYEATRRTPPQAQIKLDPSVDLAAPQGAPGAGRAGHYAERGGRRAILGTHRYGERAGRDGCCLKRNRPQVGTVNPQQSNIGAGIASDELRRHRVVAGKCDGDVAVLRQGFIGGDDEPWPPDEARTRAVRLNSSDAGRGACDQARERGGQVLYLSELGAFGHQGPPGEPGPMCARPAVPAYCPDGQVHAGVLSGQTAPVQPAKDVIRFAGECLFPGWGSP